MKRLAAILLLILNVLAASAQTSEIETLKQQLSKGRVSCNFSFVVERKNPVMGSGSGVIQGDCWSVRTGNMKMMCDGRIQWTVDSKSKEVYIEDAPEGGIIKRISGITSLEKDSDGLSGTYTDKGSGIKLSFNLSNIKSSAASNDMSPFRFDTKVLGKEWVVTDLRQ